jgi:hypothetical protein
MPQEDYIKREIDKLGKLLAKALADLLGLKSKGKLPEGIEAANVILQSELELDLNALLSIPENELLTVLSRKKLSNVHLEYIADVLFESADGGIDDLSLAKYSRALIIYKAITDQEINYSINRHFKIDAIRAISGLS